MREEIIKQEFFILTQDMVPIWISDFEKRGCSFVCPLPKDYKKVVESNLEEVEIVSEKFTADINNQAGLKNPPFQNILLGYHDRLKSDEKKLLKNFEIKRVHIDKRGVYGVWASGDVNCGDIYLNSNYKSRFLPNQFILDSLSHLFEPSVAFCCHNIDYYWQALLTREFCIRYFNWLNKKITEGFNK